MNPLDTSELIKARDLILNGGLVAMPTETVYGLAASIESEAGLKRIFSLKERPFFDPLIVHVASFRQAQSLVVDWPPVADFLARLLWPGPLTIVLPKAAHVNPLITSGLMTVAVRYPSHPIALDLIRLVGHPLAAPSANRFGRTSPSRAEHVKSEFPNEDLLVLDGGPCDVGIESTVISVMGPQELGGASVVEILRPGGVSEEELRALLAKWSQPVEIRHATSVAAPGHMKHHYMPDIPLAIVGEEDFGEKLVAKLAAGLKRKIRNPSELVLDPDPTVAARELYAQLREIAESGCDAIYVRLPSGDAATGLWSGIWDRLNRAATADLSPRSPM